MEISKGNVRNVNKRILAGTLACTFLATKLIGYQVARKIKYSHVKSEYAQLEDIGIKFKDDYAILPEKVGLNFNNSIYEPNNSKDNYGKNKSMGAKKKGKTLQKIL